MTDDLTIACMKWGDWCAPHGAEYVNILYDSVRRNLDRDFRFVCATDDPSGIRPEVEVLLLYVPDWRWNLRKRWAYIWRKSK